MARYSLNLAMTAVDVLDRAALINRYYDPATGQFLNVDPAVGITQAPYTYVDDDPLNATDPNGMLCLSPSCLKHDVTQAWNNTGGKAVHFVSQHKAAVTEIAVGVTAVVVVTAATVATGGIADAVALGAAGASEEIGGAVAGGSKAGLVTFPLDATIALAPVGMVGLGGLGLAGYGSYELYSQLTASYSQPNCG